jgi:hypothetical protein
MTRREGELTIKRVRRDWPHHVELLSEKVKGVENDTAVSRFANTLSVAPAYDVLYRNDTFFHVYCFKTAEDAQAFAERFGGELLPVEPPRKRR